MNNRINHSSSAKTEQGFTLIELIMVIVILGILAATAIPKFTDLTKSARTSSVKALEAAIREAVDITRAKCAVTSGCSLSAGTAFVTLRDGTSVRMWQGYPDAGELDNGIHKAVDYSGFSLSMTGDNMTSIFSITDAPIPSQCSVKYVEGGATAISSDVSGC